MSKIIIKSNTITETVPLNTLTIGDVFLYNDKTYIKVGNYKSGGVSESLDLINNKIDNLNHYFQVLPAKTAELNVTF